MVTVGGKRYALPVQRVREIVAYTPPRPLGGAGDGEFISLRGEPIQAVTLAGCVGAPRTAAPEGDMVIMECSGRLIAVIVDRVDEVLTVGDDASGAWRRRSPTGPRALRRNRAARASGTKVVK